MLVLQVFAVIPSRNKKKKGKENSDSKIAGTG